MPPPARRWATCARCGRPRLIFEPRGALGEVYRTMCGPCYRAYLAEGVWVARPARTLPRRRRFRTARPGRIAPTQADWIMLATVFRDMEWEPGFRDRIDQEKKIPD